jgi:hypothetical protein
MTKKIRRIVALRHISGEVNYGLMIEMPSHVIDLQRNVLIY